MRDQKLPQQMIQMALALLFIAGCGAPVATLNPTPSEPAQATVQASADEANELSPLGVLRSTDHGVTWTFLGNAYMRNLTIKPVDPTGFAINNSIVLYLVDLDSLTQPVPQIIYRATSTDGVNLDQPQPVYTQTDTMVDPVVLPMQDGTFRLYVPSKEGIISAISSDGLTFVREEGVRITEGGMPGALLLPDGRVRIFLCLGGILSDISDDGLNFSRENGMRIPPSPKTALDNPQPVRLRDGSYLMLYQSADDASLGQPDAWRKDIHLATSTDGYNWTTNLATIANGGTSALVETPDGTLFIYYGN
jgi:hypothetical protein